MTETMLNLIRNDAEFHGENAGKSDGQHGVLSCSGRHLSLDWTYEYVKNLVGKADAYAWDQMTTVQRCDLVDAYLTAYGNAYVVAWDEELEVFLAPTA